MVSLINKWDEIFFLIDGASSLSFTLFNVTIQKFSHGTIVVESNCLIQRFPTCDDLAVVAISNEIIVSYFPISTWNLLGRSCPNFVQK